MNMWTKRPLLFGHRGAPATGLPENTMASFARALEGLDPPDQRTDAGFRIDDSEGSLYLWCTRDEPCRDTVDWLAERGILVAPGDFYGPKGAQHVRVAFTATDERVSAAVARLTAVG